MRGFVILFLFSGLLACKRGADDKAADKPGESPPGPNPTTKVEEPRGPQVVAPFDLKSPPADATKLPSGLAYKKLVTKDTGAQPKRNDAVMINFTGWSAKTGETFFTNQGSPPMPMNLSQSAMGFVEGLQLMRVGEKVVFWMPPELGYKDPQPPADKREPRVYQVELSEVKPAPPVPENVARPPDNATALKSGTKYVMLKPGTEKENVRPFDTVTYSYTGWDATGRMIDTTEFRQSPKRAVPYKESTGMNEMLTQLPVGGRARFWIEAEKMLDGGPTLVGVQHGQLCYEVEVSKNKKSAHEPPPPPPDVAKPPADAKKTAKGVFYRMLAPGSGKDPRHPKPTDSVKVNYTGWTTNGHMFDSSYLNPTPGIFNLSAVVPGWTDGIPLMAIGDRMRFWIPEELAYKGKPNSPQGMLVFDVELLEIMDPSQHH